MLKEGIFLGKRYEILSRIGSGGMADVYKGKDHKLNRYVAIKVLKSDYRTDEVFIQKFLSEAQAAAGLMHPNVVNVYDVGQDRGLYYMVMELVEGITLKEYIEKKGKLTAKETISISIQMATGIQAAHNQHIIHRDIKPQNIIISKEGKVKVTDFGIARATTATKTISGNIMGSVHYTSPEQARGAVVDEKSDIYSAGVTMYEMITGHVPFDGDSTVTVALKHLQEEIISPAKEVPDIPYSLECIIMKCTQKIPEHRYLNCHDLILDLKRSLVNPDGDFVNMFSRSSGTDTTIVMPTEEMARIQERDYDEDDDYDDYDDDYDYDSENYDSEEDEQGGRKKNDVDPNMKKIMKILMIVAAAVIAIGVIFMVGKAAGLFKIKPSSAQTQTENKVSVPNLVGMTEEEAKAALSKKNLGYYVSGREASDKYDKGIIIRQETAAKKKVAKNSQINVVVSTGKKQKTVSVPDVVGQDEASAQKALEAVGLVVANSEAQYSDTVAEGKVISTSPSARAEVEEGAKVTMVVSLGVEKATVPTLTGLAAADADAALAAAGLAGGNVTEEYSDEYEAGIVMNQGTEPDKKVTKGTAVDYVVSKGPEVEMVNVPSLTNMTEDAALQALEDAGLAGNVTYQSSSVTPGYVISQSAAPGSQLEKGTTVDIVVSEAQDSSQDGSGNGDGTGEGTGEP
ncbi:serine/threonine-protein kinase [Muricomes intestini]|uniref:non-specific serine/threonine protein kinase n=1 Tax=Muricomes intestini TaxID=1796634 RepID=A0A4R3K328_9FIRM|nr:Stk1 family PASTA domain-containing Ser/Thr kinase [Muricomes intestini]TCS77027.1 serine/threonine-protein kinase [Muricomes intestini]